MTKTYWRKARRRQDYDARADQDHMELHEWLQQLKDKTMSHLELLMQKGDIQGPPYTMPDDIELSFMRKFIERQAAGIPHNPRLRNSVGESGYTMRDDHSVDSGSPDMSDQGYGDHKMRTAGVGTPIPPFSGLMSLTVTIDVSDASSNFMQSSRNSHSPTLRDPASLAHEATTSSAFGFVNLDRDLIDDTQNKPCKCLDPPWQGPKKIPKTLSCAIPPVWTLNDRLDNPSCRLKSDGTTSVRIHLAFWVFAFDHDDLVSALLSVNQGVLAGGALMLGLVPLIRCSNNSSRAAL